MHDNDIKAVDRSFCNQIQEEINNVLEQFIDVHKRLSQPVPSKSSAVPHECNTLTQKNKKLRYLFFFKTIQIKQECSGCTYHIKATERSTSRILHVVHQVKPADKTLHNHKKSKKLNKTEMLH